MFLLFCNQRRVRTFLTTWVYSQSSWSEFPGTWSWSLPGPPHSSDRISVFSRPSLCRWQSLWESVIGRQFFWTGPGNSTGLRLTSSLTGRSSQKYYSRVCWCCCGLLLGLGFSDWQTLLYTHLLPDRSELKSSHSCLPDLETGGDFHSNPSPVWRICGKQARFPLVGWIENDFKMFMSVSHMLVVVWSTFCW